MENKPDIVLNIEKPVGWSSNDVIRYVRRIFPNTKVGHAGTLDPFAQGVLIVCVGKATKKVNSFVDMDKEYVAEICLGKETNTLDIAGNIVAECTVPEISKDLLRNAENEFTGTIEQTPPAFSALKVQGQRAYDKARNGEQVELEKRKITVYQLSLVQTAFDRLLMRTVCSKGTYVRTLAQDIGKFLGTCAYVQKLTRVRIGQFSQQSSLPIHRIHESIDVELS